MKKIIDFATSYDSELWNQFQAFLLTTNDDLKENYVNLDPRMFACFPVVILDNKIVCFSALQLSQEKWGPKIGRVSTRMWIHPDYRHQGKFVGGDRFLNTTYCLPLQLSKAKLLELDCVFISREHNHRAFKHYLDLIEINCKTLFELEPTQYNVCGSISPVPDSCKQYVALNYLTNHGVEQWDKHMNKYKLES
jgi:hypothetical protein